MFERPKSGERAVLVHVNLPYTEQNDFREFAELSASAGAEVCHKITTTREKPDPKYFIGTGKVDELHSLISSDKIELVLFDHELSPAQERNLEKKLKCRVLSRTGLILDIFAQRARTHEGKLQVELAQLKHLSTRLIRGWTHLERQKGGIGLRGPGETQLESDRRMLRMRIKYIERRLEKVRSTRQQSRRARSRAEIPTVALVGYTNAGKSTLFNKLTDSDAYVANKLFATLDPTLRSIHLKSIGKVVLADTVGFVRKLPHNLVDAFRATLEETLQADLLLHVVDRHDENFEENIHHVNEVLAEIGAEEVPQLTVFNKVDLISDAVEGIERANEGLAQQVWVSALSGQGIDVLLQALQERLEKDMVHGDLLLHAHQGEIRARLYHLDSVEKEIPLDDGGWEIQFRTTHTKWQQLCQQYKGLAKQLK